MAKRTQDFLMEQETIIRWDETDDPATLWTASPTVRKEWEGYGFKPKDLGRGWRVEVPKNRITYKMLKKG